MRIDPRANWIGCHDALRRVAVDTLAAFDACGVQAPALERLRLYVERCETAELDWIYNGDDFNDETDSSETNRTDLARRIRT